MPCWIFYAAEIHLIDFFTGFFLSHIKQSVGGINLIVDVPAKAKKPTLYATALMTHLFTNEEMRQGSVEPKETHPSKGKKALDQTKINLIKSEYPLTYITCSNHYTASQIQGRKEKLKSSCPLGQYISVLISIH